MVKQLDVIGDFLLHFLPKVSIQAACSTGLFDIGAPATGTVPPGISSSTKKSDPRCFVVVLKKWKIIPNQSGNSGCYDFM